MEVKPRKHVTIAAMIKRRLPIALFPLAVLLLAGCAKPIAPGAHFTSRQQRDDELRRITETRSFMLGRPNAIKITPDGATVLFLRSGPRDRVQNLYAFDVATGQTRELLTAAKLLGGASENLTVEEKARRERQRITAQGFAGYELSDDGKLILIALSGKLYVFERDGEKIHELSIVPGALDPHFSPDARWVSFVADNDLHRTDWRTGQSERLTTGGTADTPNALAEFVAQEELDRSRGYWWSPDSSTLLVQHSDLRDVETLYIADPAKPYVPPQSWRYPRAGANNAKVSLNILRPDNPAVPVKWDADKYPYLAVAAWPKNAPPTIIVLSRDQKDELLLKIDPATGATTELVREHDDTWVNRQSSILWLDSGNGFLWITEKDGEQRLWLHDANGKPLRALNDNSFRLNDVLHVDEPRGLVYVSGCTDPTTKDVWTLHLDRLEVDRPRPKGGYDEKLAAQTSINIAKDHNTAIVSVSGPRAMPAKIVCRLDGSLPPRPLPSVAETPPFVPNVEYLRVGPKNEFDASIVRPRNFTPGRKYPVILYVYGGPSEGVVFKDARPFFLQQWYADQGFIVLSTDNRGIQNRGRAWERAVYGNFAGVPLDDQVTALKALGNKYPELDLNRVGITGWSFGGYLSALATMHRGDVFAAGAAGAPVADWTDYDTCYTERYLNTPQANPDGYKKSSLLTYAPELHRPLLIHHGTADDNVYFGNSLRLTDALNRNSKPFEFVPLANVTHLLPDPTTRFLVECRIAEFFNQQLQKPPNNQ